MNSIVAPLVILLLFITYFYYFFTCGELYEGQRKNLVFLFLSVFLLGISLPFRLLALGIAALLLISFLFFFFYSQLLVREFWWRLLLPGIYLLAGASCLYYGKQGSLFSLPILNGMLILVFALLCRIRGYLRKSNLLFAALLFSALAGASLFSEELSSDASASLWQTAASPVPGFRLLWKLLGELFLPDAELCTLLGNILVTERFHGYLSLSREDGVFGTEVTIPKP